MAAEWYYAKGDKKHGPITEDRLRELAESGELRPTDKVWRKGTKGWVEASTLPDLISDDGPPPLATSDSDGTQDWKQQLWNRIWADKLVFLVICFVISFILFLVLPLLFGTTTRDTGYSRITEPSTGAVFVGTTFGLVSLALFVAVVVMTILRFRHKLTYMSLPGKWHPVDGRDDPLEFSGLNTVTRGSKLAGTFVIHKDKRMEIMSGGQVVEVWQLVKIDTSELVIRDASGAIKRFKKKGFFSSDRTYLLTQKWEPVEGNVPAIQFTKDGAVIRFDGFAARYTFSGEEPNEVITIHVENTTTELKVLSLSREEMVLNGEGGSVHYKRGVSISAAEAKRRSDAFNEKMKAVGKGALLTVGAIGAGIAILGVAAAAGAGGSARQPGSVLNPTKTCSKCGMEIPYHATACPYCGSDRKRDGSPWSGYDT